MSTLTYFTVTGTFLAALKDSVYDVDNDPELAPMSGAVTFTPLIDSGDSLPATTLIPASNLFLVPVKATIRSGVITCNGATGVKLVANTAVLGLTGNLYYRVDFGDGLTAGGKTYSVRTYDFQAPTSATTVDLVEVTPVAGQPATGPVPSSAVLSVAGRTGNIVVVANDINNASPIGKSLLTAADQAAVQAIVGPGADGSVTFPKLAPAVVVTAAETIAANNNDTTIPTSAAVQAAIGLAVTGLLDFKGATNASANPNYPAASKGDAYVVSVAGKVGGASGKSVDVGDMYLATADNAGGTQASVGASWAILEHNLVGALLSANNLSDIGSAATARANLGAQGTIVVNAKDAPYSAVGNGSTNDRTALAAADTAAVSAGVAVLFPAGTYKVSSNLTIASPVVFQPGAIIKPDSGITVTLSGGVTAAPSQRIADHTASGLVVPLNVGYYHPGWWGAVGTSNDSQAWIDMAAALVASATSVNGIPMGQRVQAPAGINRIIGVTLTSCDIFTGLGSVAFVPPNGTTSGVVLTLGNYSRLNGGSFTTTQSGQAVTCLYLQGYRAQADGIYVFNQAASSKGVKLGDTGQGSTSPILTNARIISGNSTPTTSSVGLDVQSADVQCSNIMVAQYDTGILNNGGSSGRWSNVHVWGCNTGIAGTAWDDCQVRNVYLDSNRGWGMDVDKMDRAVWDGIYAWNNGNAIGSTGGIRLQQTSGSAQRSTLRGVILDDNVGTGLHVNGTADYEIDAVICSASVQSGGSIVTTTGVNVASAAARLTLDLQGSDATTPLTDSSTTTQYGRWARNTHAAAAKTTPVDADAIPLVDSAAGFGPKQLTIANLKTLVKIPAHNVASSNLVKNANTTLAVFLTLPTTAGQAYLIRGAIVVAGNQAADMQFRLQNSGATSPSGWFSVATTLANSTTSGSAASVQDANNADILASGGNTVACGLVTGDRYVLQISGYLLAGSGGSQSLDCMVSQSVSDASNTTFYAGSWMELMPV